MYKIAEPHRPVNIFIGMLFSMVTGLLLILVVVHQLTKIPFANFTADPAATFNFNPFFGYVSNLGIIFWGMCVSVCFLSAAILNARRDQAKNAAFLMSFGALTAVLMLDDLFMIHESLGPNYLNISEKWFLIAYGLYASGCFYHFRAIIFNNSKKLLILAMAAFGSSIMIDQVSSNFYMSGEYLFEDGLKLIGISSWLCYFLDFSFRKIVLIHSMVFEPKSREQMFKEVRWNYQFGHN